MRGYLSVGQSQTDQLQHLSLAWGQGYIESHQLCILNHDGLPAKLFVGLHEQISIQPYPHLFNFMTSSDLWDRVQKAALHRDTYSSMLKGLLYHGSAKHLAERFIGITPVYLSNLLDADHNPPSEALAHRIVHALPLDTDQRLGLLEHLLLARHYQTAYHQGFHADWSDQNLYEQCLAFHSAYSSCVLEQGTALGHMQMLAVRDLGKSLLNQVNPHRDPLRFAEACLIMHNLQSALNRWDDALFYAKWSESILQYADPEVVGVGDNRAKWDHLRINALDAQIIAYRNLNLPRRSADHSFQALQLLKSAVPEAQTFWMPHLLKDRIETLWRVPRFALGEIEGLADQVRAICEARAAPGDELLLLLVDRALVNGFTRYGSNRSYKKADRILRQRLDGLDSRFSLGLLPRTMFTFTAARYYWSQRRHEEWQHWTREGLKTAAEAGLRHQLSEARRSFGNALDEFDLP